MRNALSVDLEDWFHAELVRPRLMQGAPVGRIEAATEPILDLLKRHEVRATFFVVGEVLRDHPRLARRIYEQGHEIGCHGHSHRPLWELDPQNFAGELVEFDRAAAGVLPSEEIVGFRAPTFSLDERSAWAIDVLQARGYRYDSSIFPLRNSLYGIEGCPCRAYHPTVAELTKDHPGESFVELPMSVLRLGLLRIPVTGGAYLRATPSFMLKHLLRRINAEGRPAVVYLHPWEADRRTPRVKGLSPLAHLVTHYNSESALPKLEALLQSFSFAPLREVLGIQGGRLAVGGAAG